MTDGRANDLAEPAPAPSLEGNARSSQSLLAGLLWQGFAGWGGFGPAAPFAFGAAMAGVAAVMLVVALPARGGD